MSEPPETLAGELRHKPLSQRASGTTSEATLSRRSDSRAGSAASTWGTRAASTSPLN
ncbi:MAG: hypothetical protein QM756_12135 [Polyangiaceae bacterium]